MLTGCIGAQDADRAKSYRQTADDRVTDNSVSNDGALGSVDPGRRTTNGSALSGTSIGNVELSGRIDITFTNTSGNVWPPVVLWRGGK